MVRAEDIGIAQECADERCRPASVGHNADVLNAKALKDGEEQVSMPRTFRAKRRAAGAPLARPVES
jgi:hypothetical protein